MKKTMNLFDKNVLITGAAGCLGREVTRVAKAQGAKVILLDLGFPQAMVDSEITVELDLTDAEAVKRALAGIDVIDAVINVAGGFDMGPALYEVSQVDWDKMFALNVVTAKNMIAACLPKMLQRGRGAVINVGAAAALSGAGNMSAYCSSKSVVMNMTQSLSEEVKHQGINVNAVLPSVIDTPANRNDMPDADFSEWVSPEQLANVICFLISDLARGIHGALIPVRGLS
jgi:NAD(P)-dependent dehydrogenase (short-subunit alcohol dehydrogenase family)